MAAKRGSVPISTAPPTLTKMQSMNEPANDWRISVIEAKQEGNTPSDVPPAISPDKRVRKFVGTGMGGAGADMMISAIKQDRVGLPGQDSDGELDFVVEESGMIDKDDLNHLQSPFFDNLDEL